MNEGGIGLKVQDRFRWRLPVVEASLNAWMKAWEGALTRQQAKWLRMSASVKALLSYG